tara:strand:- start:10938 stop:12362 length:1425 start_codon:yes stop_codon:yes gene_type:complete
MIGRIVFRVDANQEIGFGHLVRCISISETLTDVTKVVYSTEDLHDFIEGQNDAHLTFNHLTDSHRFIDAIKSDDIVILDGYQFDTSYHNMVRSTGAKLMVIDDLANQPIHSDVIVNPNPLIESSNYQTSVSTQFCIGLNYALLRSPFIELAQEKEKTKTKNSLLICFGGSDPLNKTEIVVNAALNSSIEFSEINIVLGPGYKNQLQINELAEGTNRAQVHIAIDASEMAALMARNEYAIIPCSSIFLEALTADMKILSGYYVDNQKYVYDYYLKNNWFADAKSFTETDIKTALPELTKRSISTNVIDGKSMGRIKKVIQLLARENASTMRRAVLEDIRTTFEWANLPETRLYSLNKDDIPWINHEKWFIKKIASENCWYGILEHDSKLRGSIRFDIEDGIALISYLVDPQAYRMGFGTLLLKMGIDGLLREKESIREIHGVVMEENFASMKTFEKFGFELSSSNGMPLYIKKLT